MSDVRDTAEAPPGHPPSARHRSLSDEISTARFSRNGASSGCGATMTQLAAPGSLSSANRPASSGSIRLIARRFGANLVVRHRQRYDRTAAPTIHPARQRRDRRCFGLTGPMPDRTRRMRPGGHDPTATNVGSKDINHSPIPYSWCVQSGLTATRSRSSRERHKGRRAQIGCIELARPITAKSRWTG